MNSKIKADLCTYDGKRLLYFILSPAITAWLRNQPAGQANDRWGN